MIREPASRLVRWTPARQFHLILQTVHNTMLWARFQHAGRVRFGTVEGDSARLHDGDMFSEAKPSGEQVPLGELVWLTPCVPSKLIALWNNFHALAEKQGLAAPAEPLYFSKGANSYCAHLQPIRAAAAYAGKVVFEGELGVVIGRRCKEVSEADAPHYIFGYTCVNDVTALDLIARDPAFAQWTRAKSFDTFGVFGPVIATGLDPLGLSVRTIVDGKERQNYPVSDMIFKPAQIVSLISRELTLNPGDIISCGTSVGVGTLKPGATVEVAIEGIGVLRNQFS
jgi:2-keto-4-pentenoate hydratase/2-oxohepta-3-ene-1,7-dioic acid hydratase in catechol pathway